MDLLPLAARAGFFNLSKATLGSFCEFLGRAKGEDLFATLQELSQAILPDSSAEERNLICERRLGSMRRDTSSCVEELGELDDGIAMLDKNDEKDLRKEIEQRVVQKTVADSFAQRLQEKRAERHDKRATGHSLAKASGYKGPKQLPSGHISHEQAKSLSPPGGFVWRGTKSGTWQGHYPPMPRVSNSWHLYGEREALVRTLRSLWGHWATLNGVDKSKVPIAKSWDEAGPEGLSTGASSSGAR